VAKWNDLQRLSDGSDRPNSTVTSWDAEDVSGLVRRFAEELGFAEQLRWPQAAGEVSGLRVRV
jgi:hypothetical protein